MTLLLPPLDANNPAYFPPVSQALKDPDGLLAIGGDLSPARLICAYERGIFPWFSSSDPYLWWSPSERAVIEPLSFHPSRSLKKYLKRHTYQVSINQAFDEVITQCATLRGSDKVWITEEMQQAYRLLHHAQRAHSVEVWQDNQLIGGLYGVSVGAVFCGESMFSLAENASKTALWFFCQHFSQHGGKLIDCQMMTAHLASLGATPLSRPLFLEKLITLRNKKMPTDLYQPQWI
jgi:leucyl/phenylalanyl-tRNA--protein transferase